MEKLRGFRDIYPEEMRGREKIFSVAERVSRSFGYEKIDFPSLEPMDLYRMKSGEELVGQTFSFVDRGGREVTLVPEATPSVVRMLVSRKDLSWPVRWFSFPKFWRYEEPQSGRLREFYQFNADLFGPDNYAVDAENISLAAGILDGYGLSGHYELRINSRELMNLLISKTGASSIPAVLGVIDRLEKTDQETLLGDLVKCGMQRKEASNLLELISTPASEPDLKKKLYALPGSKPIMEKLEKTISLVRASTNSDITLHMSTVRGLSYYTGIVFEAFGKGEKTRSILGGGRYNEMAAMLSGSPIPAIGFGMGDVVIEGLMRKLGIWNESRPSAKAYICTASTDYLEYAFTVAGLLRRSGMDTDIDLSGRSLSAQMKSAAKSGAKKAIIIGAREKSGRKVTLRNMETGEQQEVDLEGALMQF
ncbi:MAG: histidine--tRNA ligase [Candidatus Thermoplasmatota archaeon]|nr:histidine--tRNA ligase [Candidatus Thermoplasmatota archaeon]MCL5794393.1 histidine--tRNA ligase [Candidatus Thermoplasmatota archaeon]